MVTSSLDWIEYNCASRPVRPQQINRQQTDFYPNEFRPSAPAFQFTTESDVEFHQVLLEPLNSAMSWSVFVALMQVQFGLADDGRAAFFGTISAFFAHFPFRN